MFDKNEITDPDKLKRTQSEYYVHFFFCVFFTCICEAIPRIQA